MTLSSLLVVVKFFWWLGFLSKVYAFVIYPRVGIWGFRKLPYTGCPRDCSSFIEYFESISKEQELLNFYGIIMCFTEIRNTLLILRCLTGVVVQMPHESVLNIAEFSL